MLTPNYLQVFSLSNNVNDGLRLKKAAKILITEDVSISEVLYRVGINSNTYFTKSFKAQFGMTPTEFIQQNVGRYN